MLRTLRVALRILAALAAAVVLVLVVYAGNVAVGMRAVTDESGTVTAHGLHRPVTIARDGRGVPHIRALDEHDLFFAQGYAEASDRLFQLDLLRRFVYGQLSEVLGKATLQADERARTVPVARIVDRQFAQLDAVQRDDLEAFAGGVNSAMASQPVPVEFRLLMYSPSPWTARDTLAVGFATVMDLTDTWDNIAGRSGREPLSDPCYDAPVLDGLSRLQTDRPCALTAAMALDARNPVGSNAWGAGAARTSTGRALIANDPHLRLGIPGVWYLNELQAPGIHVAGATLAGTPGVTLGHNERIAWGATNGTVSALSVFFPKTLDASKWETERFHVRFAADVTRRYYRDAGTFGADVHTAGGQRTVLVRWNAYDSPRSPLGTFYRLNRARSTDEAVAALRNYPGPTQNFVLADTGGRVAYYLAGQIPNDPAWSQRIHPPSDLGKRYPDIPFADLPHVAASRDGVVWTANNRMYGAAYPFRLTAQFDPPYRAFRIATMLEARKTYDAAYFTLMQNDVISIPERELAHRLAAGSGLDEAARARLERWNGSFDPASTDASIAFDMRKQLQQRDPSVMSMLARLRSQAPPAVQPSADAIGTPWSTYGAVAVKHPLAALGARFLNGWIFPGNGDGFTVHNQSTGFSQSFRAVWDVGNWDGGGIVVPQGESGQPGSAHYTDQGRAWVDGRILPLPFDDAAVRRAATETLTLTP